MSSQDVAIHAVNSMLLRKRIAIPGIHNKLFSILVKLAPRSLVIRVTAWLNRPREPEA